MLYPRYTGSFVGRVPFEPHTAPDGSTYYATGDRVWSVTISQEAAAPWPASPALDFDADSPVSIEWDEAAPEDVTEGSTATLRLISPSFQYFSDLYTVDPLGVTVEICADGVAVWRGSLEPELFEEPYATARGYTVELTFADFAPMERSEFAGSGRVSLDTILRSALGATAISETYGLISSTKTNITVPLSLADVFISADNFFDEDGQAMNLKEAVEVILRPFALHLRQWGGKAWAYDWNALASAAPAATGDDLNWTSTDATKSIAPVAHKITLDYSTYSDTTLADGALDTEALKAADATNSLQVNTDYDPEKLIHGFSIYGFTDPDSEAVPRGLDIKGSPLFRIVSGHSGSDCSGIVAKVKPTDTSSLGVGIGVTFGPVIGAPVMTLDGPWLSSLTSASYYIRVSLNFLLDTRYNPYETADKWNEKGNYDRLQNWANFGYIPVALELIGDDGVPVAHYVNRSIKNSSQCGSFGSWAAGAASLGDMWLAYYDAANRKSASGFGGWKKNRQCIGYWRDSLPAIYEKRGEGEYVPFPTIGGNGRLRLTVYGGVDWFDYGRQGEASGHSLADIVRWCLYGAPEMEIVRGDGSDIPTDDIIYTGIAIEGAASDIDVSLKAGSAVEAPTARAVMLVADNSGGLTPARGTFYRSRAGIIEELLLDTLISQYDSPHLALRGEMSADVALSPVPRTWSEGDAPGKRFLPTSVRLDAIAGTADATMREISPDSYTPIE